MPCSLVALWEGMGLFVVDLRATRRVAGLVRDGREAVLFMPVAEVTLNCVVEFSRLDPRNRTTEPGAS